MADPVAINDAGDVMVFSSGEWRQADVAQNARGERVYLSGNSWLPVPARERGVGEQTVRAASQVGAGFNRSLANTLGALPDAVGWGMRQLGIPNAPAPGFYRDTVQRGINAMVGEPPRIENTLERAAYGAGQGLGDAAAVAIPATAISNAARAGSMTANVAGALSAQPALQAASGAVGGAVGEATDSPLLGTAASLAVPLGVSALGRAAAPVRGTMTPERQRLVDVLQNEGIDLTPGQRSGNRVVQGMESAFESLPFTATSETARRVAQNEQFTRAALRRTGTDATAATPEVLSNAQTRIGGAIGDIMDRTTAQFNAPIAQQVRDLAIEAQRHAESDVGRRVLNRVEELVARIPANGEVPGRTLRELDTAIGAQMRNTQNGDLRHYLGQLQESIRQAVANGAVGDDAAALAVARRQYANLVVLERAVAQGVSGAAGNITPTALKNALQRSVSDRGYSVGQGDLNDLARAGQAVVRDTIPNSGTAERTGMRRLLTGETLVGGGALAGGADPLTVGLIGGAALGAPRLAQIAHYGTGYLNPRQAPGLLNVDPGVYSGLLAQYGRRFLEGR